MSFSSVPVLALTLMTASKPVFLMRECLRSSSNRSPSLVVCERGGKVEEGREGGREGRREGGEGGRVGGTEGGRERGGRD